MQRTSQHSRQEPGYYADGRYGIRIENVVIVQEAETPNDFGNGYLSFEHVTMVSAFE
jgi:Xaa-Pro aminopeptidase